jgi:hypothetical protein
MDDAVATVASSEASTPIKTPSTHTNIAECSILECDGASICTTSSEKMLGAMVVVKVLVNVCREAVDTRNTPAALETHEIEGTYDGKPNEEPGEGSGEEPDEEPDEVDGEEEGEEGDDSDSVYDDGQPYAPRRDWKAIRAISDEQITNVVQKHLAAEGDLQVTYRTCGTYHLVVFITPVDTTRPSKEGSFAFQVMTPHPTGPPKTHMC